MKTYLFYVHVMVLMCAFNMQASSSSSSSSAAAAASASAASVSVAAGLQMKTKYDASQAGIAMAAITPKVPKVPSSSSSSSACAAASASAAAGLQIKTKQDAPQAGIAMAAITAPQVPNSGLPSSAGAAASVSVAAASAGAIAAGAAQAKAKQEGQYTRNDVLASQFEYARLTQLYANTVLGSKKLEIDRDNALAAIAAKIRGTLYHKLLEQQKNQEELQEQALAQKASEAHKALGALDPVDKPNEQKISIKIFFYGKQTTISAYASDNVLMVYSYLKHLYPQVQRYNIFIPQGNIGDATKKMTIREALGGNFSLRIQGVYTPEQIVRVYNTQMGK